MQKPAHSVPGTVLAGADGTCVYTVVTVKTEPGELTATVCTPRALLSSAVANDLSDGEMALLVVLNAGVPGHLRGGLSQGFQVRGLVGIRSERAAAVHLRSQSPHCRVEQETLRKRFDELSRHNASCHYDERGRVISGSLHLVLSHELARAAAERVEQERQAELAQTGNMLNLQIQGSAVERAAEAGSRALSAGGPLAALIRDSESVHAGAGRVNSGIMACYGLKRWIKIALMSYTCQNYVVRSKSWQFRPWTLSLTAHTHVDALSQIA